MIDFKGLFARIMNKDNNETYDRTTDSLEAIGEAVAAIATTEIYPDGCIWYDEFSGITGTTYPYGTPEYPVNSEADAQTLCVNNKIKKIHISGEFIVPALMNGYEFHGGGRYNTDDTVNFNTQDVDDCAFHDCSITGNNSGGGLITAYNCYFVNPTGLQGSFCDCMIQACSLVAAAVCDFHHCCGWQGLAVITAGTPNPLNLFGWTGAVRIAAMTGGTCNIWTQIGSVDIPASDTGGILNIYGISAITNATGGTIVNDYTIDTIISDVPVIDGKVDTITTNIGKFYHVLDYWSVPDDSISVTNVAADIALPSVVVAGLPAGATIVRVIAMFKFRAVANINVGNPNALNGAQEIQVNDSAATGWVDAINLVTDQFTLDADTREGGDVFIGAIDISARVDGNDTYSFQWDEAVADVDGINFNDLQTGLRVWYRI